MDYIEEIRNNEFVKEALAEYRAGKKSAEVVEFYIKDAAQEYIDDEEELEEELPNIIEAIMYE